MELMNSYHVCPQIVGMKRLQSCGLGITGNCGYGDVVEYKFFEKDMWFVLSSFTDDDGLQQHGKQYQQSFEDSKYLI